MNGNVVSGLAVVVLAGILNRNFAAPMKRMTGWRWENSWLVFAVSGLLVLPWIITFATVPNVSGIHSRIAVRSDQGPFVWVAMGRRRHIVRRRDQPCWNGVRVRADSGNHSSFGSLLPLAILHSDQLLAKRGLALIAGTVVMVLGLLSLALAGRARERDSGTSDGTRSGFTFGLIICILSGVFSSMLEL